jgi:2-C-methyl-D-erythritol 4-phosphate cytidylyltransferase
MSRKIRIGAVIVAAGASRRMAGTDKMTALLAGKTIVGRVLDTFQNCGNIDEIVVVLNEASIRETGHLVGRNHNVPVKICAGGERRQDSVKKGLAALTPCDWVVIHDGARPLVTVNLIEEGIQAAAETGAAVAAVPVTDTLKLADGGFVRETLPRQNIWAVQTPQVFRYEIINQAHQQVTEDATDDAAMVERLGCKVKIFPGSYRNIKITTPGDLLIAEAFLKNG